MRRREFIAVVGGAAICGRLPAAAQSKPMPVVGVLSGRSAADTTATFAAFRQGLGDAGYVEGRNVAIEYRWAEGRYDRFPALLADLVGRQVDVIVAAGGATSARAAKAATSTIPIVFFVGADPVALGLVASLARPGGNLTGSSVQLGELTPKRVELLSELVPQARTIVLLANPKNVNFERIVPDAQAAARAKGVALAVVKATSPDEIDAAFAGLGQLRADGLVVGDDPFFAQRRAQFVALAARHAVPAIYFDREFVAAGGLISYAPSFAEAFRLIGVYTGQVLKGAKPADLPIEQPTKFELVVNLKTAAALGLAMPQSILARADEVIE